MDMWNVLMVQSRQPLAYRLMESMGLRPKMTWQVLTERDCREWKLWAIHPHDRHTWRFSMRSTMHAASQLPRRGPTDVDVAPVPAC